jgi:phi13 family phage major tail protein
MPQIYEYRGVEGLVYAPVTADNAGNYTTGAVKELAGVATISKSTASTNEAHYYDNLPAVVVSSTGSDEITITASAIPLDVLAEITGQLYDPALGTFVEQERTPGYFAIGYITQDTNGNDYYVWRLKGTFNIPDQTSNTKNDGTDANGQEITFTGISTTHKFTKTGKAAKAVTVNTGLGLADVTNFFSSVQTPDTITAASATPEVVLNRSNIELTVGETATLVATTTPAGKTVTWSSSSSTYATVADGVVTAEAAGTATITAQITVDGVNYTDTCAVTVKAPTA